MTISSGRQELAESELDDLSCPRCGRRGKGFAGCGPCSSEGIAVNLALSDADLRGLHLTNYSGGPWAWRQTLPLSDHTVPVSMGEGNTPMVPEVVGDGPPKILYKLESLNPTGSHKDRAMAVGVTKGLELGASIIVAASSGNAGASAAAYAARAGLGCVILTTPEIPMELHAQIRAAGAAVCAFEDSFARNRMLRAAVDDLGWFPVTNVVDPGPGSNAYAIEGYKSIAYEIARDSYRTPDVIVVPTSRADLLAGVHKGFRELRNASLVASMPRLVAAEPDTGAAFASALDNPDPYERERTRITRHPSPAFSVGGDAANWQGLNALLSSDGWAESVCKEHYLEEYRQAARRQGVFMEPSSAVGLAAARVAAKRGFEYIVCIVTATGLKDPKRALSSEGVIQVEQEGVPQLLRSVQSQLDGALLGGWSAGHQP